MVLHKTLKDKFVLLSNSKVTIEKQEFEITAGCQWKLVAIDRSGQENFNYWKKALEI